MAVLLLDEVERLPKPSEGVDRIAAVGNDQAVEQHRRHRLQRSVDVDRFTRSSLPGAQVRPDIARHGAKRDQLGIERLQGTRGRRLARPGGRSSTP